MFKDKEVDTKVKYKLGIFDSREPSEQDLEQITDIFLTNLNPKGEKLETDISEIARLKKLKNLDLRGFELTQNIVETIDSLEELEVLSLYSCSSRSAISLNLSVLKRLILDNCKSINLAEVNFPENVLIINGGVVDLSKFINTCRVKRLEIKSSEIIYSELLKEIKNLKMLNVDGSTLDNEDILNYLENKKISVSYEYEYNPIK